MRSSSGKVRDLYCAHVPVTRRKVECFLWTKSSFLCFFFFVLDLSTEPTDGGTPSADP